METTIKYEDHSLEMTNLLTNLGYDIRNRGAIFFEELVYEARRALRSGDSDEEIKEKIPNCITEYGSSFHEIGRKRYVEEINKFFNNQKLLEDDSVLYLSLEEKVIFFLNKLDREENKKINCK